MSIKCGNCGKDNRGTAKFCRYCGKGLVSVMQAAGDNIISSGVPGLLDGLVGLDEIKRELNGLSDVLDGMKRNGASFRIPYNTIIIGNSGTAKTLTGNLITSILESYGVITKKTPEVLDGSSLEKMGSSDFVKIFNAAKGGVLFIDNAHKLVDSDGKASSGFGTLITQIDSSENDPVVILAGLPFGFREFVKKPENKNITGRFQNIFFVPDYTPAQCSDIVCHELDRQGLIVSGDVKDQINKRFRYLIKDLKRSDSEISAHNGYLALKEAREIMSSYFKRKVADKIIIEEDVTLPVEKKRSLDEIMAELDAVIGMENIKAEIRSLFNQMKNVQDMAASGTEIKKPVNHFTITGNPGTGKTKVARLLGSILEGLGVLETGHVIEVDRSKMVAGYIAQTAPQTNALCDQAMGGVLFIDEAYTLAKGGENDFGVEAIEALLKRMEDDRDKFVVVAAGYKEPMDKFISANDGLKSRFNKRFHLEDYNPEELVEIFKIEARQQKYIVEENAAENVLLFFKDRCSRKTKDFANGREARNLFEDARRNQSDRLAKSADEGKAYNTKDILTITAADIPLTTSAKAVTVDDALKELNELTGLASVKEAVNAIINTIRAGKISGEEDAVSKHFIFYGNPGTGKTTVARILGDVFKGIGMLPSNNRVEVDRGKLVGTHMGQTPPLVNSACDSAMGGILFIDEAYSLNQGAGDQYGKEAVDTLVKRLEDDRGKFVCIAAGYKSEMDEFIESNSGFKSRFTNFITFEDYTPDEMVEIFNSMAKSKKIEYADGFEATLRERMKEIHSGKSATFANARTVRQVFEKTREKLSSRIIGMQDRGVEDEILKREIRIMRTEDLDRTVTG